MKSLLVTLRIILIILLLILLTVFTQVGGVVLLLSFIFYRYIDAHTGSRSWRAVLKFSSFIVLYILVSLFILPLVARCFHREPLPVFSSGQVKPLRSYTWMLNRHYVRKELKQLVLAKAEAMQEKYPGTVINYLDAGFPLFNGFPLFPHRSHNDGKKLDLAFFYISPETRLPLGDAPSPTGYGICEGPLPGEPDMPAICSQKSWQYSLMQNLVPQSARNGFAFDAARTRALLHLISDDPVLEKIFIEPHLKMRLGLTSKKIRFHGCSAVRHDDHVHIQMR